ncbi:membrane protein [Allostella sp. ATCC 35155]|nr:membrane protein [Stella sp. ATCC 35155]
MGRLSTPPSPTSAGLAGRCPRCGRGPLFQGFLSVRDRCPVCGLDLSRHDSGDGPAVFVILILGALVVGLALWVELRWQPPLWVHAALWTPFTIGTALLMLRPLKGVMVALNYRHRMADPNC